MIGLAQRCLAAGYPPVPILRPDAPLFVERDGRPVKQTPGKQPHGLLWNRKEREVARRAASLVPASPPRARAT